MLSKKKKKKTAESKVKLLGKRKEYKDRNTLGATVVAVLTTRPRNNLLEIPFCPKGAKEDTLTQPDEALSPSNDKKPFVEIADAVS